MREFHLKQGSSRLDFSVPTMAVTSARRSDTLRLFRQAVLLIVLTLAGVAILTMFTSEPAHASTSYSWVGLGQDHTNWTNPKNWNPNGVPGAGDDVTITSSPDD